MSRRPFDLVPRSTVAGSPFGGRRSRHRGRGTEVVGTRAYRPGDHVRAIDWAASARLSAARGSDEFIVREHYADEAPRVWVVLDRSPTMRLYEPPFPWLDKRAAALSAAEAIALSAASAQSDVGLVAGDVVTPGSLEPRRVVAHARADRWDGRGDDLPRALALADGGDSGAIVFVVSDFLRGAPARPRGGADIVPVIVQDPVWEQTFPPLAGVTVPFADAETGEAHRVRISRAASRELADRHERRLAGLLETFGRRRWDAVLLSSSADEDVDRAFARWAERRRRIRRRAA